ncbi:MAG: SDR family oxidoreductase [Candidatus Peribacter sp.]|jgi:NAD(P)-dependent dehydrogenase (short-subunit alcohol dehydrogenase family)|nr:SDR family oxidoreductase [Candidatus Peribacter sp.]MBT4393467.1 SDR family oxidoreductase [Candidatus Peribacter sp.]MBT4600826.1 SDR family oxidoreductase [Candidatus Peribacter sp.]MBT5149473.1 SDR family oxidoreductase [Candidatus Peribacter sp.]MBT5637328.1 SDR family oxidoreductase [Candidatus Peribacter sp.]
MTSADYLMKMFGLKGEKAVVIGGTGTLGGAMCDTLAYAGASVIVSGRKEKPGTARAHTIRQNGGIAAFHMCDCTDEASLQALVEAHGDATIVINAQGDNSATPFLEIEEEEALRLMGLNYHSVMRSCQLFGGKMIASNGGSIINIASASSEIPLSRVFTYSATKAAVLNLTKNLAREWATQDVRVNALTPGFIPAEQSRKVLTPDRIEQIMNHTPANRFGEPYELATALLYLVGPGSSFTTGTSTVVDGGYLCKTI